MLTNIDRDLEPISPNYIGAYLRTGIQLYDVLEWVLKQTGKADVSVITFSISEEFIRKVFLLQKDNMIEKISVVVDFKAIQKTQKILTFAGNVFSEMYYAKTHAKLVLIENESHKITITGSQNFTRGNREENGIITNNSALYEKMKIEVERIKQTAIKKI